MRPGFLELMTKAESNRSVSRSAYISSIAEHMTNLLNSRHDFCPHTPDYGLPDMNNWYRQLPGLSQQIAETIFEAVTKYEPRLHAISITVLPFEPQEFALKMRLNSLIHADQSTFTFHIELSSQGRLSVREAV